MALNKHRTDDEDMALQDAINASLMGAVSDRALKLEDETASSNECMVQAPPKRVNIDDRIKDLAFRAALELPHVYESGGDTWIFIDPPPMQPEQDQLDYASYIKRYEKPILMKKDTLIKYSPFFKKSFEPTAQFRVSRRRDLVKALRENNVKYVIDLTPPSEGEEAVYLMTELCCSEGVRLWYQAGEIWKVASTLVGGEEEYTSIKQHKPISQTTTPGHRSCDHLTSDKIPSLDTLAQASPEYTDTCMTLEYSPVRHRSAIERVLDVLLGSDPKLDSAPKVWTTFAVAKYFEIKHSKLDDYIISWLRAYPNSYFLEVLPEVSLQIAEGLENYELARDTFAILVGEEALDNLCRARNPNINNKLSIYGRKKEDLPEHIHTRVEYASKSFLERISNEFAAFVSEDMFWIDNLPEYQKLASHTEAELCEDSSYLKHLLKDFVRGAIYRLLCINYDSVPAQDLHHPGGKDLLPRVSRSDVWTNDLSINERILSRTFWEALKSFKLFEGDTNLDIKRGWNHVWDTPRRSSYEKLELSRETYREIGTSELGDLVASVNQCLREKRSQPSFNLPIRSLHETHVRSTEPVALPALPADLMQPQSDFIAAQITQPDVDVPTQPINVQQPSRVAQAVFDHDPVSTPDNRPIAQESGAQWPFGAPRQGSALDVLRTMNNSQPSTDSVQINHSEPKIQPLEQYWSSLDERFGISNRTQRPDITDRSTPSTSRDLNGSEFPSPSGFSSRTNEQIDETDSLQQSGFIGCTALPFNKQTEEVDRNIEEADSSGAHQTMVDGRSTPPFFRNDDALLFENQFPQSPRPSRASQRDKVTIGSDHNKLFILDEFFVQAYGYIRNFARTKLDNADQLERPDAYEIGITNTLVCLQDSEWKYLPLWAGGNDDGSGGVFNDQVPMADFGFSTAGPDVHDGTTPASSSVASSEYEMISAHSDATSTFNTSMANNRGYSDHIQRGRVYAADSADAASSHQDDDDSFTVVTDDDEEDLARRQTEAQERIEMAEEAAAKEARRIKKEKEKVEEEENYGDVFIGEDADDEGDQTDRAEDGDFDDIDMTDSDDGLEDLVLV